MSEQIQASASMNSSYNGNPFHNDLTNKDLLEIDLELSKQNLYFIYSENGFESINPSHDGQNFFKHELSVFGELYSDEIQRIADNYRADRHDKKADELLEHGLYDWVRGTKNKKGEWSGKYRPRETILEWGNMELKDKQPSPSEYSEMIQEMSAWECSFATERAKIVPLDYAIHVGEAGGIHVHKRDTYCYFADGVWRTGNLTECLKNMGIKTPADSIGLISDFSDIQDLKLRKQAEKTFQRYNNETAQWDKMRREKWHEILESHGYQVAETLEPRPAIDEMYELIKAKYRDGADVTITHKKEKTIQQYKRDKVVEKAKQQFAEERQQIAEERNAFNIFTERVNEVIDLRTEDLNTREECLDKREAETIKLNEEAKHDRELAKQDREEAKATALSAKKQFEEAVISKQLYDEAYLDVAKYERDMDLLQQRSSKQISKIEKTDLKTAFFDWIKENKPEQYHELVLSHKEFKESVKKVVEIENVSAPKVVEKDIVKLVNVEVQHLKKVNEEYEEMQEEEAKLKQERNGSNRADTVYDDLNMSDDVRKMLDSMTPQEQVEYMLRNPELGL